MLVSTVGFPGGSNGKESTWIVGDLGSVPGMGRSLGGGHGNPLQYSCLENPHGQRSLADYRPWGHKESDKAEQLSIIQYNTSQSDAVLIHHQGQNLTAASL